MKNTLCVFVLKYVDNIEGGLKMIILAGMCRIYSATENLD